MKTILVPVDYSPYSTNAVNYAIGLASKINAGLHIFHCLETPRRLRPEQPIAMPADYFGEQEEEAVESLIKFIERLKSGNHGGAPLPPVTNSVERGSVAHAVAHFTGEQHLTLIVMGIAGAGKLERLIIGSNSRKVINNAKVPVLLVPKEQTLQPFKKIGFATELDETDLNSIFKVAHLLAPYNPEILLAHVDDEPSDYHNPTTPANMFLSRVSSTVNYAKIYYRHVKADNVEKGLKWLSEHGGIDLLVMVHRHAGFLTQLFEGSHTHRVADATELPLLVMPEDRALIGW